LRASWLYHSTITPISKNKTLLSPSNPVIHSRLPKS
jgi:hypothetical protein